MSKNFMTFSLAWLGMVLVNPVWAQCYKMTASVASNNTLSNYYFESRSPGGVTNSIENWDGAVNSSGSAGTLPGTVNLNNTTFQPDGTVIASGVVNFLQSGSSTYQTEQVLFRCTADEVNNLYEFYATNGDSRYAGNVEVGSGSYQTYVNGMALRATNMSTGQLYSRFWKSRQLTNLDRDSRGWILVKAKNFSNTQVELIRDSRAAGTWSGTGIVNHEQPATYIAFKGGTISANLANGADSNTVFGGFAANWPGAVSLHNRINVARSATCRVDNVTPSVVFPVISVAALKSGETRQMPFTIQFGCQTGAPANTGLNAFASGVGGGQTAMGLMMAPENVASVVREGLATPSSGLGSRYLLSDGYGTDSSIASGVGVQITRANGTALTLLIESLPLYANPSWASNLGWFPVLDDAVRSGTVNGITTYTKTLYATFRAIPNKRVTAGKYTAALQVIVQVI